MDGVLIRGRTSFRMQISHPAIARWRIEIPASHQQLAADATGSRLQSPGYWFEYPGSKYFYLNLGHCKILAYSKTNGTAYVIGKRGLTPALHDIDYMITHRDPDCVVWG